MTMSFDAADRIVTIQDGPTLVTMTYDENGNALAYTDAESNVTLMTYDARNQMITRVLPDGSTATAKVRDTAPSLDERSRLGLVYADLVPGSHARAGMYANGQIVVGETQALIVPAETVVIRDGRAYVVKLVDRHATPAVALERVALGRRRNDEVEIVSGLTGAETLVEAGAGFLSDGDIVRVASTDTFQSSLIRRERTAP